MGGEDVALGSTALITSRADVFTLPLENPRQTPAFEYDAALQPRNAQIRPCHGGDI